MKKSILTIGFLFLVLLVSAESPSKFDFGLKMGINFSMISVSNPPQSNYSYTNFNSVTKPGFDFGAFARYGGKRLFLQSEILYSRINGESSFYNENLKGTETQNLSTIKIPLLFGIKLVNLKSGSLRVFTGPSVSVLLPGSTINVHNFFVGDSKNYNSIVGNWQAGAGLDVSRFTFDVRYEYGLSNICDGPVRSNQGLVCGGNSMIFSVGYKIF